VEGWHRYSGSGNTFVLCHDRDTSFNERNSEEIRSVCSQYDVDGLIVIRPSSVADCCMVYMNRDGTQGALCGNGLRCTAHFVQLSLFPSKRGLFIETKRGVHAATVQGKRVAVEITRMPKMVLQTPNVGGICYESIYMDTGVPHLLIPVPAVSLIDVDSLGKKMRDHPLFHPEGTNVTFVEYRKNFLRVRTYERGVERETGSCGTGMVAAGALFFYTSPKQKSICVVPSSQEKLTVYKKKNALFLEGNVSPLL